MRAAKSRRLLRWWRAGGFGDTETVINSGSALSSAPAGYRFPREVIAVAVRWYLRCGLSYRDVEELLAERGIVVDHVTVYRWVQTFTPEFIDAALARRHAVGDRWFVDETYVKVAGAGPTSTGPSISMGRSSTSWSPSAEMRRLRGLSSSMRCGSARRRSR
jgi:hypothetical protein